MKLQTKRSEDEMTRKLIEEITGVMTHLVFSQGLRFSHLLQMCTNKEVKIEEGVL